MADHDVEPADESLMEKVTDKFHDNDSSSDSDDDKPSREDAVRSKTYRLFGREDPVHKVLGGGKPADVLLWRDKKISVGVLVGATAVWVLFELLEYHLLKLVCHLLILLLAGLFLWSNASAFINKSTPQIPEIAISEYSVRQVATALTLQINRGLTFLRLVAAGKDLKTFLGAIATLWALSVVGGWFNLLTLFYIVFVILHTGPVFYEKYEDQLDPFAEKAMVEFKKQYAVFYANVSSKIPKGIIKDEKTE